MFFSTGSIVPKCTTLNDVLLLKSFSYLPVYFQYNYLCGVDRLSPNAVHNYLVWWSSVKQECNWIHRKQIKCSRYSKIWQIYSCYQWKAYMSNILVQPLYRQWLYSNICHVFYYSTCFFFKKECWTTFTYSLYLLYSPYWNRLMNFSGYQKFNPLCFHGDYRWRWKMQITNSSFKMSFVSGTVWMGSNVTVRQPASSLS